MYRNGNVSISNSRASIGSVGSENQMLLGDESENMFLVYLSVSSHICCLRPRTDLSSGYSFIFTMQEYARELISLVDAMGRICSIERANAARGGFFSHLKPLFGLVNPRWRSERNARERFGRGKRSKSMRKRFCASFAHLCHPASFLKR